MSRNVRSRSNFAAKTASDTADQLGRRWSLFTRASPSPRDEQLNPWATFDGAHRPESPGLLGRLRGFFSTPNLIREPGDNGKRSVPRRDSEEPLLAATTGTDYRTLKRESHDHGRSRSKSLTHASGTASAKLGTFAGVFVPTTLNVLSILMFLRFGFILGQSGVTGMLFMLVACYAINLLTTMSVSAIATNGTVRGGGAYYLISRSLGPEFGGSIGIVFYIGCVFNTGMNAVGLIDCLTYNFGATNGGWAQWLPDGFWWGYLWATVVLVLCTIICLAGSGLFARASNALLVILLVATFSIPISTLFVQPFESRKLGIEYTGLSLTTFKGNLFPAFTKGASGSQLKGRETWQDLFGILFPATGGIFAGASMSGDLKHPSKAIPKGTLYGLVLTFCTYAIVILALAATVTRASMYRNVNVIQDVNASGVIVLLGEFATTFFSALMGVIGSAKLLQALARDNLIPGLSIFGQGTKSSDEPTYAIIVTYLVAQLTMLADINQIASFVTMTYLMTFLVTNLACFLLTIGSAPNFRPSFRFFNWETAFFGTVISGAVMFFVDRMYAAVSVAIMAFIFLVIHYTTPPKSWGDVSQSLIYHQVRKYLLRLRNDHIKFWRPSVLLLVNDPRRQYKLIQFCNSLKKGGLFILGHVIVTQDFAGSAQEAKRQQTNWQKYIDFSKIKAFINIVISPAIEWGSRNIVLSAGLGGMRPNIVVMGFFNLNDLRRSQTLIEIPSPQQSRPGSIKDHMLDSKSPKKRRELKAAETLNLSRLPTDVNRPEGAISATSYMTIMEDLLLRVQINVAVAKGFQELEIPAPNPTKRDRLLTYLGMKASDDDYEEQEKRYIDLWPIQMSAEIASQGDDSKSVLTTNFDTYTLILQLGCILDTVPSWKRAFKVRVCVFVEYESDVEEERARVTSLLTSLRIQAEVLVFWLACGSFNCYEVLVNGKRTPDLLQALADVDDVLEDEEWWQDIQNFRARPGMMHATQEMPSVEGILDSTANWPTLNFRDGATSSQETERMKFKGLRKIMRKARRRASITSRGSSVWGAMRASSSVLNGSFIQHHRAYDSPSESSSSEEEDDTTGSESEGAASEGDIDVKPDPIRNSESLRRSRSMGNTVRPAFLKRLGSDNAVASSSASSTKSFSKSKLKHVESVSKERPSTSSSQASDGPSGSAEAGNIQPSPTLMAKDASIPKSPSLAPAAHPRLGPRSPSKLRGAQSSRPPFSRQSSTPKFSSNPVPATQVATDETQGRSIMFADPTPQVRRDGTTGALSSIYHHPPSISSHSRSRDSSVDTEIPRSSTAYSPDNGQPLQLPTSSVAVEAGSVPFSFNDLPSRAQHLILNELIAANSAETAVVFTTLPTPVEGTCESERDSVKYLSDLEVLCHGIPPVLLVHSNSITVTMNL